MQQDHLFGPFVAGGVPLADQLRRRVREAAVQQQMLTDFQVETVRALQVLRQQQMQLLGLVKSGAIGAPTAFASGTDAAPLLPALDDTTVVAIGSPSDDVALLEGAFARAGAFRAGTAEDALAAVKARAPGESVVVHLADAEACLRPATDLRHAEALADGLIHKLKIFRQLGGRVAWTIATMPATSQPFSDLAREMTRGLIAGSVDRIHVYAEAHRLQLEAQFPTAVGKVVVIAHPGHAGLVASHVSRETARRQLGLATSVRLVLMLTDGLDEAAWRMVVASVQDLAGSGLPLRLLPVSLSLQAVAPSIAPFVQPLDNRDRHQWLFKAADGLLVAPRRDFWSDELALAASFATPVLAPPGYGPVDGAGLVYDPRDPQELRKALAAFTSRPDASRSGIGRDSGAGWARLAADLYRF